MVDAIIYGITVISTSYDSVMMNIDIKAPTTSLLTNLANEILETYYLMIEYFYKSFRFSYSTNYTLAFTSKLTLCLMFLIVIRGCVPRYRYDFLTKMG